LSGSDSIGGRVNPRNHLSFFQTASVMVFLPFSDTLNHPWVFPAALPARRPLQLYQSLTRSASHQLALISGPQRRSSHSCFVLRAESVAMRLPTMIRSKPTSGQSSDPCDPNDQLQSVSCNLVPFATPAGSSRSTRHRRTLRDIRRARRSTRSARHTVALSESRSILAPIR
jgi:hypothetical protein